MICVSITANPFPRPGHHETLKKGGSSISARGLPAHQRIKIDSQEKGRNVDRNPGKTGQLKTRMKEEGQKEKNRLIWDSSPVSYGRQGVACIIGTRGSHRSGVTCCPLEEKTRLEVSG